MKFVSTIFIFILVIGTSYQQAAPYFQPYGPSAGDSTLSRNDDGSSSAISFSSPIIFWGTSYSSAYVNNNGIITLGSPTSTFTPSSLSALTAPSVVPYWGDVDTRPSDGGYVYYRNSVDSTQLNSLSSWIRSTQGGSFQGTHMFITTWYQVGYFSQHTDKLNTFQAIIIADDNSNTYGVFNYGTIQWTTGDASSGVNGLGGTPAAAGFAAGDRTRYAEIPGSFTADILNLPSTTNAYINGVPQTGQYVYLISQGVVISSDDNCDTDADCNEHGICVPSYRGKGCSCLSGFGGNSLCDARPASCVYNPVYPNATNFSPSVAFSVASSQISFAIAATLEQTEYSTPNLNDNPTTATTYSLETQARFGGSYTPCDYPPSLSSKPWVHSSADASCTDNWSLTVPWAFAVTNCGFSDSDNDHTWTQTLTVSRKYKLPDLGDGNPVTRTESITKLVKVVFPTSVNVQTDVNVTGPVVVSVNAIASSSYDPGTDTWIVLIKTLTNRPYKLTNPAVASTSGEINTDGRFANKVTITDNTACNSNSDSCTQTISLSFGSCNALSGGVVIQTTPVCSGGSGATCPAINTFVNIGIEINNAESCGVINQIDFSLKSLSTFEDSALTVPKTQFAASDIAYFGATIQSTNATITGLTLTSACMSWNGQPCVNIAVTNLANTGGYSPVFAVNLAQTRYFTSDTSLQTFTVKAVIAVTWANGKRETTQTARANIQSTVAIDLSDQTATFSEVESGSSLLKASLVFAFSLLLLFAM